jgi:hypothetical protein
MTKGMRGIGGPRDTDQKSEWVAPVERPHMCFPPPIYPQQISDASVWCCRICETSWQAMGVQRIDDHYPVGANKTAQALLGPEYWRPIVAMREIETWETDLYDFRGIGWDQLVELRKIRNAAGR